MFNFFISYIKKDRTLERCRLFKEDDSDSMRACSMRGTAFDSSLKMLRGVASSSLALSEKTDDT